MSHDNRAALADIIRDVRRRWRWHVGLRGAAIAFAATIAAILLSASSLQALRFTPASIVTLRVVVAAAFVLATVCFVVRPLGRSVSDVQVALYLEERDPSLQASILSAVEAVANDNPRHSRALVDRLVGDAAERARAFHATDRVHRDAIVRSLGAAVAVAVLGGAIVWLGPAYLRHGVSALLVISRPAEAASPYRIDVRPGNATLPRRSDLAVSARLQGFHADAATLKMRSAAGTGAYRDVPLVASSGGLFEGMLFHVAEPVQYFVESNGVRSPVYTLALVDLPAVKQLDLEYRYPAYTGLPAERVESGGDVAALRGTEVAVRITPTLDTPGGAIVLNENTRVPLVREADGTLTGLFRIDAQGFYRIELTGPKGERVTASPQYTIDLVGDQSPSVTFVRPGRDTSATTLEELQLEARAEDDYGIRQLDLVYSANGGAEKTVRLSTPRERTTAVSAAHTLYLEELGLKPGDSVSYYARATDNDTIGGPKTATSDIYFVQIRPFRKDYKPAESQAQMGGGAGGQVGALSQQQRQIVAATFNTVRDRAKMPPAKYRENMVFLTLAQSKLRQQVDALVAKMASRQVDDDPAFADIAATLPKASTEMRGAETELQKQAAREALSPEQRALEFLQQAEQKYEVRVGASRGGGGGQQSDEMADDLADLFQLEMDKLANQYEMQQRAGEQGADRQIDALAERLKELARRQQLEAERQQRMAAAGGGQAGGGGSQRALADEAEQAARQLEQLTRDRPQPDLSDAARRLQRAADAMRKAAANGARDGGTEAAAAERELRDAMRQLQGLQGQRGDRDVAEAQSSANALADQEKQIAAGVKALPSKAGAARAAEAQRLAGQKNDMEAKVDAFQQQLDKLSDATRVEHPDASRKLQEAANGMRDSRLNDKIRYSKGMLQGGNPEYARQFEESIAAGLDALKDKIGEAVSAMGQESRQTAASRALERMRELERRLQSLGPPQRAGRPAPQEAAGRPGQAVGQSRAQAGAPSQAQAGAQGSPSPSAEGRGAAQGGPAGGRGGRLGAPGSRPDEAAQLQRELRDWQSAADAVRREAAKAGVNTRDLSGAIRESQRLDDGPTFNDPAMFEQLRASAMERLKRFEVELLKSAEGNPPSLALSPGDDVPPQYRDAVEAYYRSLSRKKPR